MAIWSSPDGCSETDGNTGVIKTYQYDANQRMVGFSNGRTADDAQDITYRYNPDGIRTKTIIGGSSTDYIVDSNRDYTQVIAEQVNSTEIAKEYVFGYDLLSQNTAVVIDGAADGETQTDTAFYHYDSLGTTRNLSNDSGIITDDYFYEAFGDLLVSTGTTDNDYLYTGEQYDAALDNYYLRARYYNQNIGRMTQFDTYEGSQLDALSLHKYIYTHADPVNNIDPSGNITRASITASLRINGVLRTASTNSVGRSLVNNLLVGKSGRDGFGIVGETVINEAKEALLEILLAELNGDLDFSGNKEAQKRGVAVHTKLENRLNSLRHAFKNFGIEIRTEIFRFKDGKRKGNRAKRRESGTLGIDVEINRHGKTVLAFDLKTGRGFSGKKNKKLQGIFGSDVIEIFVGKK